MKFFIGGTTEIVYIYSMVSFELQSQQLSLKKSFISLSQTEAEQY